MMAREDSYQRSTSNAQRSTSKGRYDLEERLLDFAASLVRLTEKLPNTRAGNHVAGQLLRCGTSPLPNHGEAQAAESTADFIHKMSVCLKELREIRRWLRLIDRVPLLKQLDECRLLISECEELIKIFFTSIRTSRSKRK
jgi:four helix bundle protein